MTYVKSKIKKSTKDVTSDEKGDALSETDTEKDYFTADSSAFSECLSESDSDTIISLKNSLRCSTPTSESNSDSNGSNQNLERKRKRKGLQRFKDKLVQDKSGSKISGGSESSSHSQRLSLLQGLIHRQEDRDLIFHHSVDKYFADPKEFMLDLSSMWNTPARSKSYIVLGVRACLKIPHDLVGLQRSYQQSEFESLVKKISCTGWPQYRYFEITMNKAIVGIIEIDSSHGCGQPCVLRFPSQSDETCVEEMWIRKGANRKLCHFSDLETTMMFQWFAEVPQPPKQSKEPSLKKNNDNKKNESPVIKMYTRKKDLSSVFRGFERGHYILIAGDIPRGMTHADAISLVPWIAVYDFDISSRDEGLLSSNEDFLAKRRSLHISTWNVHAKSIAENSTIWYFPRGSRDVPESRVKHENDVREWFQQVKQGVDNNIDQLQKFICDYTVLTIVIIWPQDQSIAEFIAKFLQRIDDRIDPAPKIILCIPNEPLTERGNHAYVGLCNYHKENISVIKMNTSEVCDEIKKIRKDSNQKNDIKFELPSTQGDHACRVDEKEAAWLKEHLEVLYKVNPYNKAKVEELQTEMDDFFKGGSLHWYAWYECGAGHFDVERDVMKDILSQIHTVVDENRSALFTLYHAPGSGGSTLAQRILWDLHLKLPCVYVKIKTACSVYDIIEKVEFIYEKARCTVIVLIDGEDETKVKNIFRTMKTRCTMAVILYVKRYIKKITNKVTTMKQSWLKGDVTIDESKKLALKFGDRCQDDDNKKARLNSLCAEVANSKPHYLYEFGLTTYLHEFKGIESYVRGYLDLQEDETRELKPVHKMLGFLSLVYYYGQTSLSYQFFASLLNLPSTSELTLSDFPESVEYFVVPDDHDGRRKNIRICHFLIAKEILEQILSRHSSMPTERSAELNHTARKNLAEFCLEFIEYASRKKVKSYIKPHSIIHVLTRTFIFRDNKDMGQNAEQIRKKPVLSKVMVDIASSPPFFAERLKVLQKLTLAFPDDPNFHAHLGRFYAYCRPDEEGEVESCFQKALKLCEERIKNKTTCDIDDRWKMSIMHIYHMYGTVLQKRIARFTGQAYDDTPEKETKEEEFSGIMEQVDAMAKMACSYFLKCREYTPNDQDNCFGYVGEIMVRLQVCDFVQKHFKEGDHQGIYGFLSPAITRSIAGRKFVKNSISIIDSLFMECFRYLEYDDIDRSIQRAQIWYNYLFRGKSDYLEGLAIGDDVFAHRLRIAAKKLKYGTRITDISFLEDVTSQDDITEIVRTYEKIFQDIVRTGIQGSKRSLEIDYIEWLYAIRHKAFKMENKLEDVHQIVRQWNEQLRSPMSKFYLFIIDSLLGFSGKTENLVEAQILNDELRQMVKYVLKPKYPREWLGMDTRSIRRLLPGTRFLGLNLEDREMKTAHQDLQLCKGTVCSPNNKRLAGFISLDLGGDNTVPVKVFYIPNAVNMATTQFAGKRVEFFLAFSLGHGYEAFNVKLIPKYGCSSTYCSARVEITSQEESAVCPGCHMKVHKDHLNTVED